MSQLGLLSKIMKGGVDYNNMNEEDEDVYKSCAFFMQITLL